MRIRNSTLARKLGRSLPPLPLDSTSPNTLGSAYATPISSASGSSAARSPSSYTAQKNRPEFLGESRLVAAIDTDIAGEQAHSKALDADTKGPLRDVHRRVGTAILFESSGGQTDKVAHLPELRFALGEPVLDTTSVDNAAFALEDRSYFVRKAGADGFRIGYQPTMKKVVSDRRASLDNEAEVKPAIRKLVEDEFRRAGTRGVHEGA